MAVTWPSRGSMKGGEGRRSSPWRFHSLGFRSLSRQAAILAILCMPYYLKILAPIAEGEVLGSDVITWRTGWKFELGGSIILPQMKRRPQPLQPSSIPFVKNWDDKVKGDKEEAIINSAMKNIISRLFKRPSQPGEAW